MRNSLFNPEDYAAIITRIEKFQPESQRLWGKMDGAQMLAHCNGAMRIAIGEMKPKRVFIGYLLGGIFKKNFLSTKPLSKNSPTAKSLIIIDKREFEKEKATLIALVKKFHDGGEKNATTHPHSFFGKFTAEEWGFSQWKHLDHHLSQFGV